MRTNCKAEIHFSFVFAVGWMKISCGSVIVKSVEKVQKLRKFHIFLKINMQNADCHKGLLYLTLHPHLSHLCLLRFEVVYFHRQSNFIILSYILFNLHRADVVMWHTKVSKEGRSRLQTNTLLFFSFLHLLCYRAKHCRVRAYTVNHGLRKYSNIFMSSALLKRISRTSEVFLHRKYIIWIDFLHSLIPVLSSYYHSTIMATFNHSLATYVLVYASIHGFLTSKDVISIFRRMIER